MPQTLTNAQIARCISHVRDMASRQGELGRDSAVQLDGELIYETHTEGADGDARTRVERVYFRDLDDACIGITEQRGARGQGDARSTKFTLEGHFDRLDECSQRLRLYLADKGRQL